MRYGWNGIAYELRDPYGAALCSLRISIHEQVLRAINHFPSLGPPSRIAAHAWIAAAIATATRRIARFVLNLRDILRLLARGR
jgi:hypothetical protein